MFGGYYVDYSAPYKQWHIWGTEYWMGVNSNNLYFYVIVYRQSESRFAITGRWGGVNYTIDKAYVTLQYTKTTD